MLFRSDLFAYRWIQGNGGPVDVLESQDSFAILPGYQSNHAPYSPYNPLNNSANLLTSAGPGYVNNSLKVGDRIYLAGSDTLDAGFYTLLPARYALLSGGVLVTPKDGAPIGSVESPDGSSVVSGYRFNNLNSTRTLPTISTLFEVASGEMTAETVRELLPGWSPIVRQKLPFASILVGSQNDPYCRADRAQALARDWGAEFVDLGAAGHINAESQLGDWPAGHALLNRLLTRLTKEP